MGCFAGQKTKKKTEHPLTTPGDDLDASPSSASIATPALSAPPSFKKTVRKIQHARRFITKSNPNHCSVQPSHAARTRETRTSEQGNLLAGDVVTQSRPLPLPSPRVSPQPTAHVLPHPSDHASAMAAPPHPNVRTVSSASGGHGPLNSRVHPSDLQPLPSPKDLFVLPRGLRSYTREELAPVFQHFSSQAATGDDGFCFAGAIKIGSGKGGKQQQQEVVAMRLHDKLHLVLKDWLPKLLEITHLHDLHLCKPVGFYTDDAKGERFLMFEKLQKGSLHGLMFGGADTPPLDWSARMKILQGAIQGLATLHEKFPEQTLYKDFKLSHIQVDDDNDAKLSGYWFVTSNNQTLQAELLNNASKEWDNAYCAPETRHKGAITLKSHVWSIGVITLEILCGRRKRDDRTPKDEKHDLVKWAKPFLLEDDKLFLVMDPKLRGRFPEKGAKIIARLILQCLQKDPTRRPSLDEALDMVKAAQEKRHTSAVTRRELVAMETTGPSSAPLLSLGVSKSLKPSIAERRASPYRRSPVKFDLIQSPELQPISIPSRSHAV